MIDIKRVKKTRGGYEVRIYATDGGGDYPIHGAIYAAGCWFPKSWTACGMYSSSSRQSDFDLIEEPRTVELDVWLNVFSDGSFNEYDTRADADKYGIKGSRIACINIKRIVIEGEGL